MSNTITLPDMGDGITSGTIVAQHVKAGDAINEGDTVVEVETDKAVLPVPAPQNFVATKTLVDEGDEVKVGDALFEIEASTKIESSNSVASANASPTTTVITKPETGKTQNTTNKTNTTDIVVSELGDGISSGTVVTVNFSEGDSVREDETLFELETDKAVLPYPSPATGKIVAFSVKEGDEIKTGDHVGKLSSTLDANSETSSSQPASKPTATNSNPIASSSPKNANTTAKPQTSSANSSTTKNAVIAAGPAARKLSRELGIDLANVSGSKRGGRIDILDVKAFAKNEITSRKSPNEAYASNALPLPLPNFNDFGKTSSEKLSNLRLTIAKQMEISSRIPHVHQTINVNISKILNWQKKNSPSFKAAGSSLSVTLFVIKALVICMQRFPRFNASLDSKAGALVLKEYYNVGVAVDTPAGLIVPVLKAVDTLSIFEIGLALKEMAKKARERKVLPSDLKGASITVSNLGGIGADTFTPIINWPEVAILGVSKTVMTPKVENDKLLEVPLLPLVLGYDHRVIDGADAARFVVALKSLLENPENLLMGLPA